MSMARTAGSVEGLCPGHDPPAEAFDVDSQAGEKVQESEPDKGQDRDWGIRLYPAEP
jgi:hypothetical protein